MAYKHTKKSQTKPTFNQDKQHNKRIFGSMVRWWFGAGVARYVGLDKTHNQHVLEWYCVQS